MREREVGGEREGVGVGERERKAERGEGEWRDLDIIFPPNRKNVFTIQQ